MRLLPTNKNAYDSRGFTYLKMGKFDAAIADYEKALALDPNLATAEFTRCNLLRSRHWFRAVAYVRGSASAGRDTYAEGRSATRFSRRADET